MTRAIIQKIMFLALLLCLGLPVYAAEIRGQVRLAGMPEKPAKDIDTTVVVVLLASSPDRRRKSRVRRLVIRGGRISKSLVVLRPGDRLALVNHDPVMQPLLLFNRRNRKALGLARKSRRKTAPARIIPFSRPGNWYLIGRLDNRLFARIVVVQYRSLVRTRPGRVFEFRNLHTGKWKLRIYSLLAGDKLVRTEAYTAPEVHTWRLTPDRKLVPSNQALANVNASDLYSVRETR